MLNEKKSQNYVLFPLGLHSCLTRALARVGCRKLGEGGRVRRELLRRIKNIFDELGILIPAPYRIRLEQGDDKS